MKIREKLGKIGKIHIDTYNGVSPFLENYLRNAKSGIVLLNETALINTKVIDTHEGGLVGDQSVNLEKRVGNSDVLKVITLMKRNKNCTFFPGTLLRDFGGYVLPTMPVIQGGKVVQERVKQTGIAYVDDYSELARNFFGDKYAKIAKEKFKGMPWEGPMSKVNDQLKKETAKKRRGFSKTIEVGGLNVFPLICNELNSLPQDYKGKPIDVIMHASCELTKTHEEFIQRYQEACDKLKSKGKLKLPIIIVTSEQGMHDYTGKLVYDGNKVKELR